MNLRKEILAFDPSQAIAVASKAYGLANYELCIPAGWKFEIFDLVLERKVAGTWLSTMEPDNWGDNDFMPNGTVLDISYRFTDNINTPVITHLS